jgi:hypothetical protein
MIERYDDDPEPPPVECLNPKGRGPDCVLQIVIQMIGTNRDGTRNEPAFVCFEDLKPPNPVANESDEHPEADSLAMLY